LGSKINIYRLIYNTSIEQTIPYQTFLEHHLYLHHLLRTTAKASADWIRPKRAVHIASVKISETILVDLRFYGPSGTMRTVFYYPIGSTA
jgi:hypothetical protein